MGIRDRLSRLLAEAPADAEAIEHDEIWWIWGRMRQTAQAVTAEPTAAGLGEGARVGVVLENRPEHVAVVAALIASGRCTVTLSPLQPPARLAAHIGRSSPPVVIAGAEALARPGVLDAVREAGLALELRTDGSVRRAGGTVRRDDTEHTTPAANPGVAVEMLTSGTTGAPKTVNLGFEQLDQALVSGGQVPKADRLLSRSASLVSAPLVHIGGLWRALACLATGRRMILMPKFVLDQWVSVVERHKLRAASLVPAALRTVLDAGVPAARIASLEVVTSGTAPCPKQLADSFFRTYGIPVLMTYGATEFAGAVAGWTLPLHPQWWDSKAGSAGRALAARLQTAIDRDARAAALHARRTRRDRRRLCRGDQTRPRTALVGGRRNRRCGAAQGERAADHDRCGGLASGLGYAAHPAGRVQDRRRDPAQGPGPVSAEPAEHPRYRAAPALGARTRPRTRPAESVRLRRHARDLAGASAHRLDRRRRLVVETAL
ncbi:AMP-binding protein [Nocardia vaccinii]|uniref:AMP-binding protein n=1 Tax=Nocardia vaccinii TaxID=1822 RepID=UPI000A68FA76|nr:AMP-binding protein [Nocardia vaccinii]